MRRALELHWPSLLVLSACAGLAAANWLQAGTTLLAVAGVAALGGLVGLEGEGRLVALGIVLAVVGLWWGSLRLDALDRSLLAAEIGESGSAQMVTTGPARVTSFAIRVPAETRSFRGRSLRERVLLVLPVGRSPPRGAVIETVVRVAEPREGRDGGFDERAWLARQGIHVVLRGGSWRQVGRRGGIAGAGDVVRDRVERAVSRGTDGLRRALVLGVVLGEDEGLSDRVRRDFRASGLAHLLAVSGQNVAFIVAGIFGLGWLLRVPRIARELVAIVAIVVYVLAVGWQPSVVRAGVAGVLASAAWLVARPRDRWHLLAWGALVLLTWSPTSLLEPGFQLSFVAVAGIFAGLPAAQRVSEGYPVPRPVADATAVSVVCGVATAPIVLVHFGQAPAYTVVANALAFPAMPAVLGLGLLAAAADPVSPEAATALAWLAGWAAAWLELVAGLVASLPGAEIGPRQALLVAAGVTALWAAARRGRDARGRRAWPRASPAVQAVVVAGVLALAVGWLVSRPAPAWTEPGGLRVTFLDVGQGDAALLETASGRVLVDQGPPEANVAGQLAAMGIRSLSAVVLTHPQRDHVGGAVDVIRQLRVGVVLDPELAASGPEHDEAIAAARARRVPVRTLRTGSEFKVGGLRLRALWPPDPGLPSEDPNRNAVVLAASFGEADVLLPADAESDVTGRLPLESFEVLKVAHHGSEDPGLESQLRIIRPRVAVISAGRGNDYGHPRPETLAALASVPGIAVYRTDEHGRVVVETDGRGFRVRTIG